MKHVSRFKVLLISCVLVLSGCAELNQLSVALGGATVSEPAAPDMVSETGALTSNATRTAEALDVATSAERIAAAKTKTSGRALGQTVASLGSPAEPGFWLKTPLVSEETQGTVRDPVTRKTVAVTLIPIAGPNTAGSRLSLSAMRLLGANLTDLVTVDVSL